MDTQSSSASPNPLAPLTIKVAGEGSQSYKSIGALEWENIPPFAVLTGLNGSGKSQLLELIYHNHLIQSKSPNPPLIGTVKVNITGDLFTNPGEVAYLPPNSGNLSANTIGPQFFINLINGIKSHMSSDKIVNKAKNHITKKTGKHAFSSMSQEEIMGYLSDFTFSLDEVDVIGGLSAVFHKYKRDHETILAKICDSTQEKNIPLLQIEKQVYRQLGSPPWHFINDILKSYNFRYEVQPPKNTNIDYILSLKENEKDIYISPNNLSSGEQTILRLGLWLFNYGYASGKEHKPAKFFLLDEPDAFLHPSMARQFMNVVNDVLVQKHRIRVIMTTHSPSTVALAPEGSVFVMSREQPRIRPEISRDHTIGLLTAGLVVVSPATRFVLVEDQNDVKFYDAVRDILSSQDQSKDEKPLAPAPSIAFLPASIKNPEMISGGKTVVAGWINKFNEAPLDKMFRGIVDGEAKKLKNDRISSIRRHSIENYLCDPLIIYALMHEHGLSKDIKNVRIDRGNEHKIRELCQSDLQEIVNSIINDLMSKSAISNTEEIEDVEFTSGKKLSYQKWFLDMNGHELLNLCRGQFGEKITPENLRAKLWVVRMIPSELAKILQTIQSPLPEPPASP